MKIGGNEQDRADALEGACYACGHGLGDIVLCGVRYAPSIRPVFILANHGIKGMPMGAYEIIGRCQELTLLLVSRVGSGTLVSMTISCLQRMLEDGVWDITQRPPHQ